MLGQISAEPSAVRAFSVPCCPLPDGDTTLESVKAGHGAQRVSDMLLAIKRRR